MARAASNKAVTKAATGIAGTAPADSAAAEKLDNQPAALSNVAPVPGANAGAAGQDGQVIVIWDGKGATEYIAALKAGDADVILLKDLAEPLVRHLAQFVEIEGFAELPVDQLIPLVEAKVGIEPKAEGDQGGAAGDATGLELAASGLVAPGATGNSVDDPAANLFKRDDIQALFIRSVSDRGFRRCGHRFTPEGHGIALDLLTEAQIETLASDPNLRVELSTFSDEAE